MARPRRPHELRRDILSIFVIIPLIAVPSAAFFLLMSRGVWRQFRLYWGIAAVFGATIMATQIAAKHALDPIVARRLGRGPSLAFWLAGLRIGMALFGAAIAIVILKWTFYPGLFPDARSVIVALLFSVIFGALFVGLALAVAFYRKTVETAGAERELQLARGIQRSFLLSDFPRRPRLEVHAVNVSSKEVSGDFYDVVAASESDVLLAVADVSGKGVPAALLSSMLQASLRTQAGAVASPAAMIGTINALACDRDSTGQFATFFLASIHEPTLVLRSTNAGHNYPLLRRGDGTLHRFKTGGLPIGMLDGFSYTEEAVDLRPGDLLVLYTDGVTEAANPTGEMFGEERLETLLRELPRDVRAEAVVDRLLASVWEFLGAAEPGDDMTVMAVRVLDGREAPESGDVRALSPAAR